MDSKFIIANNSSICRRYKQNNNGKLLYEVREAYKRPMNVYLSADSEHNFIIPYSILIEYPTLILFKEFHSIILDSSILIAPKYLEEMLEDFKAKGFTYTRLLDNFILDIPDIKCVEEGEDGIYSTALSLYKKEFPNKLFDVFTSIEDVLNMEFVKKNRNLELLLSTLFLNKFYPVNYSANPNYVTATLIVSRKDKTQGELIFDDFRLKVNGLDATPEYSNMDKVNVSLAGVEDKTDEYPASYIIISLYTFTPRIFTGSSVYSTEEKAIKVIPTDVKNTEIFFESNEPSLFNNKKVRYSQVNLTIQIFEIIGDLGHLSTEVLTILKENFININLPEINLPEKDLVNKEIQWIENKLLLLGCENNNSLSKINEISEQLDDCEIGNDEDRVNFKDCNIFSIDPPGCTDIDDAFHIKVLDDYIEVGVHIADVTAYISYNSKLDNEVKNRGTSVYFTKFRIDMLPPKYSSNLISLRQSKIRRGFSCIYKFTKDDSNELLSYEFMKSTIVNYHALEYSEANELVHKYVGTNKHFSHKSLSNIDANRLGKDIFMLSKIGKALRSCRISKSSNDSMVPLILNESENSLIDNDFNKDTILDTHYVVEEFMLLTNLKAASLCYSNYPEYSCLRKHSHPVPFEVNIPNKDNTVEKAVIESAAEINSFISHLSSNPNIPHSVISRLISPNLSKAIYVSSGADPEFSHFGLGAPIYTHFTSPIRRYSDILVHRMVNVIIKSSTVEDKDGLDSFITTSNTCKLINRRERYANMSSRMENELLTVHSMLSKDSKTIFKGFVVSENVVFIKDYEINASLISENNKVSLYSQVALICKSTWEDYCINRTLIFDIVKDPLSN